MADNRTLRERMMEELFPKTTIKDGNRVDFFDPVKVKQALNEEINDELASGGMASLAGGRTKMIPTRRGCAEDGSCNCDC